eukprot:6223996-Prymnesium_polylepis.1
MFSLLELKGKVEAAVAAARVPGGVAPIAYGPALPTPESDEQKEEIKAALAGSIVRCQAAGATTY